MATILHFTLNCLDIVNQYISTFWPIKLILGTKCLLPPTQDTELKVLRIFYLLNHKTDLKQHNINVEDLVAELPADEDVLSIVDKTMGYNLLQLAIIKENRVLVMSLLKWYNINNQSTKECGPVVHLAASLGYLAILELLLVKGCKLDGPAGICYPDPHQPIRVKKWFGVIDQPVFKCNLNQLLPIQWTIVHDNVSCFTLMLQHMNKRGITPVEFVDLLHFACKNGASHCIKEILSKDPTIVNSLNGDKDTPLLLGVVWGRECSKTLIDFGADVKIVSSTGETALHRLYRNEIDGLFTIYDTTKYLLTTGIEQLINYQNNHGESPLHVLTSHVSYIGGRCTHPDKTLLLIPKPQLQLDYQDQVINTLEVLLKFNADINLQNHMGLDPLGKLMHIALKGCLPESEQNECVKESISSSYSYKNDYGHLYGAVNILLQHGANINGSCPIGETPFFLLLQCILNDEIHNLCSQSDKIIQLVDLVLSKGGRLQESRKRLYYSKLAQVASVYFSIQDESHSLDFNKTSLKYSKLVNGLLTTFLKNDINPNLVTETKNKDLSKGCGNALIEFIHLTQMASQPSHLVEIHKWLKTILCGGGNPDLEPYPSEPIICHSQSSIYLKKQDTQAVSHYIHEINDMDTVPLNDYAEDLLMLFYNTMSHEVLYNCLNTARSMSHFHPSGEDGQTMLETLNRLVENPRSLKQIARVSIYKSINRKLVRHVPQLPLPKLLKDYLIEIY